MPAYLPDLDHIIAETFVAGAEFHAVLGSTNDRAIELASLGPGDLPVLILADAQTAGRGRGKNRWWTGKGSLAMSLLLEATPAVGGAASLVSLAAAVAIVETVSPMLPSSRVGIHWPNDVLADGRKLAGILTEVLPDGRCVLGLGVNTNNSLADAPADLQTTAISLRDLTGETIDPTELLIDLLGRLEACLHQMETDPARVGRRADALCLQHGMQLALQQGQEVIRGRCEGIAPDGALLLLTPEGQRAFYSGVLLP